MTIELALFRLVMAEDDPVPALGFLLTLQLKHTHQLATTKSACAFKLLLTVWKYQSYNGS
jgi:hypothetical protein